MKVIKVWFQSKPVPDVLELQTDKIYSDINIDLNLHQSYEQLNGRKKQLPPNTVWNSFVQHTNNFKISEAR